MIAYADQVPLFHWWLYGTANITMSLLNLFWLYKIFDSLRRRASGGQQRDIKTE
jgi:hypothetical protein